MQGLREALNLPADVTDAYVLAALAEVATEESRQNPRFAAAVRARVTELAAQWASKAQPTRAPKSQPLPPLVPIRQLVGFREVDPFKPPDPHFLVQVYGHHQLARALQEYTLDKLKDAATNVQSEHPGTKPANRGRKDALISYIVEHTPAE